MLVLWLVYRIYVCVSLFLRLRPSTCAVNYVLLLDRLKLGCLHVAVCYRTCVVLCAAVCFVLLCAAVVPCWCSSCDHGTVSNGCCEVLLGWYDGAVSFTSDMQTVCPQGSFYNYSDGCYSM